MDEQLFYQLVRDKKSNAMIDGFRQSGNAELKRKLPAFIFQAMFDETTSKSGKKGAWRKQSATKLTGLVVLDIDHVENPKELINGKLKIENGKLVAREEWAAANNYQFSIRKNPFHLHYSLWQRHQGGFQGEYPMGKPC